MKDILLNLRAEMILRLLKCNFVFVDGPEFCNDRACIAYRVRTYENPGRDTPMVSLEIEDTVLCGRLDGTFAQWTLRAVRGAKEVLNRSADVHGTQGRIRVSKSGIHHLLNVRTDQATKAGEAVQ